MGEVDGQSSFCNMNMPNEYDISVKALVGTFVDKIKTIRHQGPTPESRFTLENARIFNSSFT